MTTKAQLEQENERLKAYVAKIEARRELARAKVTEVLEHKAKLGTGLVELIKILEKDEVPKK